VVGRRLRIDRTGPRPNPLPRAARAAAVFLAAMLFSLAGCSDEVVCPAASNEKLPFIEGQVAEHIGRAETETTARVTATADPLPAFLVAFVNGRELAATEPAPGDLRLEATLSDSLIVWQPGAACSLRVTTDSGFATARATVPGAFTVAAPESVSLGDTLTVRWTPSDGADYYIVDAALGAAGGPALAAAVRDTVKSFAPSQVPGAGIISGVVHAVSGPFPESGGGGNVGGDGWGFFTVSYDDPGSSFSVVVGDTSGR
jgi:hypothetical protein